MSQALADPVASAPRVDDDEIDYRSVPTLAVLGLVLGLCSGVVLFTAGSSLEATLALCPLPVVALAVSVAAWRKIKAGPDQFTGAPLAQVGAVAAAFFLVLGVGYGSYVYATEVPEGYDRISFVAMKPTEQDRVDGRAVPEAIAACIREETPVFLKGYIRPDSTPFTQNISRFLLVRDSQECCFGDLSKVNYFDQVQVTLAPGKTTDFHRGVFRLAGKLKYGPGDPQLGTPLTYYLDADYVQP
ncbi:MAG: hypothetical protein AAF805_06375 [Planctomycetota bacterium]